MKAEDRLLLLGRLLLLHLWHLLMVEVIQGRHLGVVLLLLPRHLPVSDLFADSLTYPRTQILGDNFGLIITSSAAPANLLLQDTREAGEAHPIECQLDFTMMFETILFLQSKMPRLSPILSLIEAINIRWNA